MSAVRPRVPAGIQPVEDPNGRQHMRRVGALASAGFEPLAFATAVQNGIEQTLFGGPHDQPGTKLAEDRTVETRVSEL